MSSTRSAPGTIRSAIPARVDRLRWTPFHTRMVVALGVAWILDGLEITIASSIAGDLTSKPTARTCQPPPVGAIATVYLARRGQSARWSSAGCPTGSAARSCSW